jgi:hypothetical protein
MIDFELISQMADTGVRFAYTTPGMSRSNMDGWPVNATSDKVVIKSWLDQGLSLVVVAHPEGSFAIDMDDPNACIAAGFNPDWLKPYFRVKSPSGGYHFHGIQDDITHTLPGIIPVYKVKGDSKSGLILEFKNARQSVAAPGAERKGQKKVDGTYVPGKFKISKGLPADCLAWVKEHGDYDEPREFASVPIVFADDWDEDAFVTHHHAEIRDEGMVGETWHIACFECPICGKRSESTLAAAAAKFIFGGTGRGGFICHACGISSREELETKLEELYPDFEPYDGPIYEKEPEMTVEELEDMLEDMGGKIAEETPPVVEEQDSLADKWAIAAGVLDIIREGKATRDGKEGKEVVYQLPAHVVDENILAHVITTFEKTFDARFFLDEAPYIFLPGEHAVYKFLDSDASRLLQRFHLRKVQRHTDFAEENLRIHILMNGAPTRIHKFGCYRNGAIHVYNGRGGMFKITTDDIEEVPNGTDGVYMKNKHMTPWPEFTDHQYVGMMEKVKVGGQITDSKLSKYFSACWDESTLSSAQYEQMTMLSYLALFLDGATELRPIRLATGPQNSGKSTLWEKHMWLFYGTSFLSGGLPSQIRSFTAAVSNHEVQLFDNIDRVNFSDDKRGYREYLDVMCKCATGGKLSIAQLYQNNVDKEYALRCNLFLTARVNPIPSDCSDVLRRTLTFPFRKPTAAEHKTVEDLKSEFVRDEAELKLETLVRLQNLLPALAASTKFEMITEMASFESFTRKIAQHEGWDVTEIWQKFMANYQTQLSQDDPFLWWFKCWLGREGNAGRSVRPGQIHAELERSYGRNFKRAVHCSNSAVFGKGMRKNFDALGALGIKQVGNSAGPIYQFNPDGTVLEECRNCFTDTRRQDQDEMVEDMAL